MREFEKRVKKFKPATLIRGNRYEKFYQLYSKKYPIPVPESYATIQEIEVYKKAVKEWEDAAQERLEEAVRRLKNEDWDYFKKEAKDQERQLNKVDIPVASGFGRIIVVDTQDLTTSFSVMKLMERAIENNGVDKYHYANRNFCPIRKNYKDSKTDFNENP